MDSFVYFAEQIIVSIQKTTKQKGYFSQDQFGSQYDKIQIMTVEDLLEHKFPNIPRSTLGVFKTAQKETKEKDTQTELF
jgi:hypothetical protein